jgi:molybdopterin synthase sulfur carrier subunit
LPIVSRAYCRHRRGPLFAALLRRLRIGAGFHSRRTDMAITVRNPTPLRTLTQGKDEVEAKGKNVRDVIEDLEKNFPGIKERLLDDKGVRRFVNIYQNEEDIRFLDSLETKVKDGDSISIVPAIAGGVAV